MLKYILKRIALMIPTLFGVLFITFAVIQFVPGGPIEQITSQLNDLNVSGRHLLEDQVFIEDQVALTRIT